MHLCTRLLMDLYVAFLEEPECRGCTRDRTKNPRY